MFHANLVSTFPEAIYRLIRMDHELIFVSTFDEPCKWTISVNVKTRFDF